MKRLAVIPSEPIHVYLSSGYDPAWLRDYFNPGKYFDEVYLLSPKEEDNPDLLGMKAVRTGPGGLQKKIKELDIDVVRAYGGYWACNMACNNKVSNVPVVVSVHDARIGLLYDSIGKADIVFCMSEIVKETVRIKYRNDNNLWILPNRVDFKVMRPRSREETAELDVRYPYKYKIVHVGRKVPEKNLDTVIKALKLLGGDYCLLAIGNGHTGDYACMAGLEGVKGRCYFIQKVSQKDLSLYYSLADCMCTPSRSEGFGMVFIEALASGAVVVTSDIAPMNGYIENGRTGILVGDYQSPEALSRAIRRACTDNTLRKVLKNKARKSVRRFEKNRIDELEAGYYDRILRMKREGAFAIPFHREFSCKIINRAKDIIPVFVRKKARDLLRNKRRTCCYEKNY
jgi:glycosyltransferase involved in cell wall biosynthesis